MYLKTVLLLFIAILENPVWAAPPLCQSVFRLETERGVGQRLPVFSLEQITLQQSLSRGNFTATLGGGQKVFLKRLRSGSFASEVSWLQRINSIGLGVEIFGSVKIHDQNYAVLEYFEGVNTQIPMMAPSDFVLTKPAITEIRRQAALLAENGVIPVDLQFQVSLDGKSVKIIDPELFEIAQDPSQAAIKSQNILSNLLMPWILEGKAEL